MLTTVAASHAKHNFGAVIRRVYDKAETLVIERAGLPVAAIISISDLERLYPEKVNTLPRIQTSAIRARAWKNLMELLDEPGSESFSEGEVEADVMAALAQVRYRQHRQRE